MAHIKRKFTVTLAMTHPSIDPGAISRALTLEPSRQSKVGQRRATPTGSPLEGTYQFSSWGHQFDVRGASDLAESIARILDQLDPHKPYLLKMVQDGGSVELFCGVFADGNWDECFHHTLLRRLSDMAIDLRLDVYPNYDEDPA